MTASTAKPDLYFGFVGAVGTELDRLAATFKNALSPYKYETAVIRLAELLHTFPRYVALPTKHVDEYIDSHMTAGNDFRQLCERSDAMAVLGMGFISVGRARRNIHPQMTGRAFLIRSLKHPDEAKILRKVYGDSFFLVAAYSPEHTRRAYLVRRIARSRAHYPLERHGPVADCLIVRDQEELGVPHGQNTRDTFHRADLFVDMSDPARLSASISRFVALIFGNTFHTPTRPEYAMFHAQAAALRSAELGRQVGASIATESGDIVAVGTNEVPKAGGGLYWAGDTPDMREFRQTVDTSDEMKRALLSETLNHLQAKGLFSRRITKKSIDELVQICTNRDSPILPKEAKIRNVIEYGRAVHAEMAALTDAARRGVSVAGHNMYVTTFPCHLCARLIVAAGIRRVIYIEPYARSLTPELYPDSISTDSSGTPGSQVPFIPFVGVSPRQFMTLFSMAKRKADDGRPIWPDPAHASPRFYEDAEVFLEKEGREVLQLGSVLKQKRIIKSRIAWRPVCTATTGSKKP